MEERKLVWNPFKKEYWRKDNLLPPEKRKQIKEDLRSMRTVWKDSRARRKSLIMIITHSKPDAAGKDYQRHQLTSASAF